MINTLIKPQDIEVDGKSYVISKFPAMVGIEIATKLTMEYLKNVGDYNIFQDLILKVMSYVAAKDDAGNYRALNHKGLIDSFLNTEYSTESLLKIIAHMAEYNFSFFQKGSLLTFLENIGQKLPA